MAGIAKIAGRDLDDIAKVAGKVVIGLGDAAVGNVLAVKTFYAGDTTLKTGTMPTVAIVAANDNYPAGYHAGDAGGLDAIDLDLAAANIKSGVTIFGKLGTYAQTLAEDVEGDVVSAETTIGSGSYYRDAVNVPHTSEITLVSKSLNFNAVSLAFAAAFASISFVAGGAGGVLRFYMGGVLMQTSGALTANTLTYVLRDFKALAGNQDCVLKAYNADVSDREVYFYGQTNGSLDSIAIAIGSVKLV